MPVPTQDDQDIISEYLRVIQDRIIAPLRTTGVKTYCTATLLILFPAIDSLGKLHHVDNKAGSNARIRDFLDYMGGDYGAMKKELLALRNSLLHNAINVESFLSNADLPPGQHLTKMGTTGYVYVDTPTMCRDFELAFNRFQVELQQNPAMMARVAAKLVRETQNPWDVTSDGPVPSQAPISFIRTR